MMLGSKGLLPPTDAYELDVYKRQEILQGETIGVAKSWFPPAPFLGTLENRGAYVMQIVCEMTGGCGFILRCV